MGWYEVLVNGTEKENFRLGSHWGRLSEILDAMFGGQAGECAKKTRTGRIGRKKH